MRLKNKYSWRNSKEHSIAEAFVSENEDREGGLVESADRNAEKALEKIGELLQVLHAKGVLSDADVIDYLGRHSWERAE